MCRQLLLAMKKRGFGEGKWNGFGGKLELTPEGMPAETMVECAQRELREESSLEVAKDQFHLQGKLRFIMKTDGMIDKHTGKESKDLHVCVYTVDASAIAGQTPMESEEMLPKWYGFDEIPFDSMWADDELWFPLMFDGKLFDGDVIFKDKTVIASHTIAAATELAPPACDLA